MTDTTFSMNDIETNIGMRSFDGFVGRKPDFFLVGAPKCGTTAMHSYLAGHPDVFMAKKERHFFGRDLRPPEYAGLRSDLQWYASFFEDAGEVARVGEASVWHLYSKVAPLEIKAFSPDADIIIMLRDPVEMMHSLYKMFIWVKDLTPGGVIDRETKRALSFEEALANEDDRKKTFFAEPGAYRDGAVGEVELRLFHTDVAMYADQVQRYLDVFGKEHVHIIIFEEFKREMRGAFEQTLKFLSLDTGYEPSFEVINGNRNIKNARLHYLLKSHDSLGMWRSIGRFVMPVAARKRLHRMLMNRNVERSPRAKMSDETRAFLRDKFRDDIIRLSDIIGHNLTKVWK